MLVIAGFFIGNLRAPGSGGPVIDARMRDDEIARKLKGAEGSRLAGWLVLAGGVLIVVSLVWRIARVIF